MGENRYNDVLELINRQKLLVNEIVHKAKSMKIFALDALRVMEAIEKHPLLSQDAGVSGDIRTIVEQAKMIGLK